MFKSSLAVLLLLAVALPMAAADFYVSTTGSDTAAGTQAAPWRTVGKINGRGLAPGDRVFFAAGQTFTDAGLVLGSGDGGNATNRVVIGSYGSGRAIIKPPSSHGCDIYNVAGITIQDLIFEGTGIATNTKVGLQLYCDLGGGVRLSGVTVTNCEFRQFKQGLMVGAWNTSYSGFQDVLIDTCLIHTCRKDGLTTYGYGPSSATLQSHRNIIVRDCEVYGITGDPGYTSNHSGSGIILSGTIGGLVDRCYVHHCGGSGGNASGGGPVGIWTWASDSVTIQRSLVHDQKTKAGVMDGGGFDIDGGATNAVVQYCYSYNNEGAGYLVAEFAGASPLTNGTIRYNVSWKDGRRQANNMGSLHFWSHDSNPAANCAGIKAYNNVLYTDAAVGGPAIRYQSEPMTGHSIRNNVVIVTGGAKLVDIGSNTGAFAITGNSYFATDGNYAGGWAWNGATSTSLAAWRATTGTPETVSGSPTGLQGDPLLVSPVAGAQPTAATTLEAITAFRLQSSSPLINAGLDLTTSTFGSLVVGSRDFFNQPIPVGAYDIGAHEAPASGTAPAITSTSTATGTVGTAFSYTITGSNTPTSFNATGLPAGLTVSTTTGVISGTPTTAATSNVTISAINAGGTGSATLALTVNAVANSAPAISTAKPASLTTLEDTAGSVSLAASDANGDTLTWSILTQGTKGVASVSGTGSPKTATYTPTANLNGSDSFVVQVADGNGGSDTITVNVTITAVNDAPVLATLIPDQTATLSTAFSYQVPVGTFTDVDNASLTWSSNEALLWLSFDAATRTFSGTPGAGDVAATTITVTASDGSLSANDAFVLTVSAVANQAPTVATGATATPNPVTGTTTALSVLGADDGSEPALTYTWATTGTPPAAVTLSANASNAAKSSTATFTRAGSYALQVTIRDVSGLTMTSSVTVTVNQTLTSIAVTPASASVVTGGTQPFATTANDQFSQALSTRPTCTWTVSGGGTISGTGLFSATAVGGPFTVTATSGTTSGAATVTVTALPTYTVTYNGNGSTGGTAPVGAATYLTGTTVMVLGNTGTLVKAGSSFIGWNTAANGSGTAYAPAATFAISSANVILYAQWAVSPNDPLLLNRNGGSQWCGFGGGLALVVSFAVFFLRLGNRKA